MQRSNGVFPSAVLLLIIQSASAQVAPPEYAGNPDSLHLLPKPSFLTPESSPLSLPKVEPMPFEEKKLSAELKISVKSYRFIGNTAIPNSELEKLAEPYTRKTVTAEDIEELRHKITLLYIGKGYINSGAVLPDQEIEDHVVTFKIVEGKLNEVNISGAEKLKISYIRNRLLLGAAPPLNINSLQQSLMLLQQKGLIEKINAELSPGTKPGESQLNAVVKEALPYQAGFTFSNHYSPSIGAYHLELNAAHKNLSGWGDSIEAKYGLTQGLNDYSLRYALPIDAKDDKFGIRISKNDSSVVEPPFNLLDITSRSQTIGLDFEHPVFESTAESLTVGVAFESRNSQTYLINLPFSFSAGVPDGKNKESVFRFSQEWVKKGASEALTLRSTLSSGSTNALPKTAGIGPDKRFISWLTQGQWAKRLDEKGKQIILLANLQWTPQTLLTLEKFGLGGANTVRGYRETQLLRDNGLVISGEYRIPVFFDKSGESRTQIAPFIDYGKGWNSDRTPDQPPEIVSIGIGILLNPDKNWQAQLDVGHAFMKFANPGRRDLQDMGIHFLLNYKMY